MARKGKVLKNLRAERDRARSGVKPDNLREGDRKMSPEELARHLQQGKLAGPKGKTAHQARRRAEIRLDKKNNW